MRYVFNYDHYTCHYNETKFLDLELVFVFAFYHICNNILIVKLSSLNGTVMYFWTIHILNQLKQNTS